MEGYYSQEELKELGLKEVGTDVLISKKASIYTPEQISVGSHVRIDDFCLLLGNITLKNYVHIAPYSSLHGTGGGSIVLNDFVGLSSYIVMYAASDDYGGEGIANATVPKEYDIIVSSDIVVEKLVVIGAHSVILPGAYLAEGIAMGAMSMLAKPTEPWGIYAGIPCRRVKERSRNCLELEKRILAETR